MAVLTVPSVAPPRSAARAECRVWERHSCDLQTSCQPIAARADKDLMWPATLRDLSVSGIGLVLGRRFERGAGLVIEIPGSADTPADSLLARVVHTTGLPDGRWLLGCVFVSPLSDDELRRVILVAESAKKPSREHAHAAERRGAATARAFLIPGVTLEAVTPEGVAHRVRVRALRLTGCWPLEAGTGLQVWLGQKGAGAVEVRGVVRSCDRGDEGWTVQLALPLASPELQRLFGRS
jgi:hypothetical protein